MILLFVAVVCLAARVLRTAALPCVQMQQHFTCCSTALCEETFFAVLNQNGLSASHKRLALLATAAV